MVMHHYNTFNNDLLLINHIAKANIKQVMLAHNLSLAITLTLTKNNVNSKICYWGKYSIIDNNTFVISYICR